MKLIITEKNQAAERIANILSQGKNSREKSPGSTIYAFKEAGEEEPPYDPWEAAAEAAEPDAAPGFFDITALRAKAAAKAATKEGGNTKRAAAAKIRADKEPSA